MRSDIYTSDLPMDTPEQVTPAPMPMTSAPDPRARLKRAMQMQIVQQMLPQSTMSPMTNALMTMVPPGGLFRS